MPSKQYKLLFKPPPHLQQSIPLIRGTFDEFLRTTNPHLAFPPNTVAWLKSHGYPDWSSYYEPDSAWQCVKLLLNLVDQGQLTPRSSNFQEATQDLSSFVAKFKPKKLSSKELAKRLEPIQAELLLRYRAMINDFICALIYKEPIHDLLPKARLGDTQALLRVLAVDKALLAVDWVQNRIKEAQLCGDWEFFKKLGKAVTKRPGVVRQQHVSLAFILHLLWPYVIEQGATTEQLYDFLEDQGLYGKHLGITNVETLRVFLNRIGLKKYQKVAILNRT